VPSQLLLSLPNLTHPPGQQLDEPCRILLRDPVHTIGDELESDILRQLLHHLMSELEYIVPFHPENAVSYRDHANQLDSNQNLNSPRSKGSSPHRKPKRVPPGPTCPSPQSPFGRLCSLCGTLDRLRNPPSSDLERRTLRCIRLGQRG
jgi:hypothetical protein